MYTVVADGQTKQKKGKDGRVKESPVILGLRELEPPFSPKGVGNLLSVVFY